MNLKFLIFFFFASFAVFSQNQPTTPPNETKPQTPEAKSPVSEQKPTTESEPAKIDKEKLKKEITALEERLNQQKEDLEKIKKASGITETTASKTDGYKSVYREKGIPGDLMRHQFVEPEQGAIQSKSQKLWLNDFLRVGFLIRPRYESRENLTFSAHNTDYTSRIMQTSQVWFLADINENVAVKITFQDSRLWGGSNNAPIGDVRQYFFSGAGETIGPGPLPQQAVVRNSTDVREAFALFKNFYNPLKIYMGRQILAYGDQRMLGGANWTQNGLSYDGLRFAFDYDRLKLDFFGMKIGARDDGPNGILSNTSRARGGINNAYMAGTYNSYRFDWAVIDLYSIGVFKQALQANASPYSAAGQIAPYNIILPNAVLTSTDYQRRRDELITSGFRITNRTANNFLPKDKAWDWTIESAWQTGRTGQVINASWDPVNWAPGGVMDTVNRTNGISGLSPYREKVNYSGHFHVVQTGYTFWDKFRVGVQYLYASGDKNRNDGSSSTFQTLVNPRFGVIPYWNSVAGLSENIDTKNMIQYSLNLSYKSEKAGTFVFAIFDLNKAKKQDAWYAINGAANTGLSTESLSNGTYTQNAWYTPAGQAAYAGTNLGKGLYTEYDLSWQYQIGENVSIWTGAGVLVAKDSIRNLRNNPVATEPVNPTNASTNLTAGQLRTNLDPVGKMFFFQVNVFM